MDRKVAVWGMAMVLGGGALVAWSAGGCLWRSPAGAAEERSVTVSRSPNFDGKQFANPVETTLNPSPAGFWDGTYRYLFGREERFPKRATPPVPLTRAAFSASAPDGLRTTWLGHSTVLIELDGRRILTDPVWSKRASPLQWLGPARFHAPPLGLEELPALDAVVISHDHYDHLDRATVRALAPTGVRFVVPLGVGTHLTKWGVPAGQVTELDWWQEADLGGGVRAVAAPARHFSGRGLTDRNRTLWASYALLGPRHRVYFGGDTGLFQGLATVGERLGPFDLTLLEIGAYDRTWPDIHLGPERAVLAHQLLRGELLQPIHWGTFNLALHDWFEPPDRLTAAAAQAGVAVAVPRPGEQVTAAAPPRLVRWWEPAGAKAEKVAARAAAVQEARL